MGDGTKDNPYTRKDVLRLIKENGGKANGLDLSEKWFEYRIDLSRLDLSGIKLNNAQLFRANFDGSNLDRAIMQNTYLGYATFKPLKSKVASLQGVNLRNANLHDAEFRGADLTGAQFQETEIQAVVHPPQLQGKLLELLPAFLDRTDFRGANLFRANFRGCYFYSTKLEGAFIRGADITDAHLGDADWGNYKIGEEIGEKPKRDYYAAGYRYRQLKAWYKQSGYDDIAGKFFFREKEVKRKSIQTTLGALFKGARYKKFLRSLFAPKVGWNLLWSWIYKLLCGYGEKPLRVIVWAASVLVLFTLIYLANGSQLGWNFWDSLYFSAVSFTALGYGSWIVLDYDSVGDWIRGIGAFESFIGVFTMALFLITFIRKMTR